MATGRFFERQTGWGKKCLSIILGTALVTSTLQVADFVGTEKPAQANTSVTLTQDLTSDYINTSSTAWPVGVRACVSNLSSGQSYSTVSSTFSWTTSGVGIDLIGPATQSFGALNSANNCVDIYYQVSITGTDPGASGTTIQALSRKYQITVDISGALPASGAPTPSSLSATTVSTRQIYVAKAINSSSQTVGDISLQGNAQSGAVTLTVGQEYTFLVPADTGTNADAASINAYFDPKIFQIISASAKYAKTASAFNGYFRNSCGYNQTVGAATYQQCAVSNASFSDTVVVSYRVKVIGLGSQNSIPTSVSVITVTGGVANSNWKTYTKSTSTGITSISTRWPLNLTVNGGSANAYVTASSGAINSATCSSYPCTQSASYDDGTVVTLTATTTDATRTFAGWGGACSGTATTCRVTVDAIQNVTVSFGSIYPLSIVFAGTGFGSATSDVGGISCQGSQSGSTTGTCSTTFESNSQQVVLTATAAPGQLLTAWGSGCSTTTISTDKTSGTCTLVMETSKTIQITFTAKPLLSVKIGWNVNDTYLVSSNPSAISCSTSGLTTANSTTGTCDSTFSIGESVTLTASKTSASRPVWVVSPANSLASGCTAGSATCTVTMTVDTVVTASYAGMPLAVAIDSNSTGTGSVTSSDNTIKCGDGFSACAYLYGTTPLTTTLTATAKTGSAFSAWVVTGVAENTVTLGTNCGGNSGVCTITWTSSTTSTTVVAKFNAVVSLTVSQAGAGSGTVTTASGTINCGSDCSQSYQVSPYAEEILSATPASGSFFVGWSGSGCSGTGSCNLTINDNLSVIAQFGVAYTITVNAGVGGTVSPGTSTTVPAGSTPTYTITPNAGFRVVTATVTNSSGTETNILPGETPSSTSFTYTFSAVSQNQTIAVTFSNKYVITVNAGSGGTVTPGTSSNIDGGSTPEYTITPNTGYEISTVTVDGVDVSGSLTTSGNSKIYTFGSISSDKTLAVTFAAQQFTIVASKDGSGSGSISPSGNVLVNYGSNQAFTFTPSSGNRISDVKVNGTSQSPTPSSYTFSNVTSNQSIVVTFVATAYTLSISGATNITTNSVTISGSVSTDGDSPQAAVFCYGTSETLSTCTNVSVLSSITNLSGSNALSANLSSLNPGTKYYYKLVVTDSSGLARETSIANFTLDAAITLDVSAIGVNGATMNGYFKAGSNAISNSAMTSVSICFSTNQNLTVNLTTCRNLWAGTSSLSASGQLEINKVEIALEAATKYYVQVQVVYSGGQTRNGEIKEFTTLSQPAAAILAPLSISSGKAKIRGEINPRGNTLQKVTFCWTKGSSLTLSQCTSDAAGTSKNDEDISTQSWNGSSNSKQFERSLSNLDSRSTYTYIIYTTTSNYVVQPTRLVAPRLGGLSFFSLRRIESYPLTTSYEISTLSQGNSGSIYYSETGQFTTAGASTESATSVSNSTAILNGNLYTPTGGLAAGDVSSIRLCFSTAATVSGGQLSVSPNCGSSLWGGTTLSGGITQGYSRDLSGLSASTQYHFQIQVVFTDGSVVNGDVFNFTTLASGVAPTASTDGVTSITTNSATISGLVNANGSAITSAEFCWGTSSDLSTCTQIPITITGWSTSANNSASANLSTLLPGTTYRYRITATNNIGTTTSTIGTFTTKVSVTYNKDSGGTVSTGTAPTDATLYAPDASITVLGNTTNLTLAGHSFGGWSVNSDGTGTLYSPTAQTTYTAPTANVTFYANWVAFTVTFSFGTGGGTAPSNMTVNTSGQITLPGQGSMTAPSAGSTFNGWSCGAASSSFTPTSQNQLCTALWTAPSTYSVTYSANGATSGSAPTDGNSYAENTAITVLNAGTLTKAGSYFGGWYLSSDPATLYSPDLTNKTLTTPAANVTFLAKWVAYTVTYSPGTGTGTPPGAGSGVISSMPASTGLTAPNGTVFGGWTCSPDGSPTGTIASGAAFTPSANTTCTAIWNSNAQVFVVYYSATQRTGGSLPSNTSGNGNTTLAHNTGNLVRSGYTFAGWIIQGVSYSAGATYNLTVDVTAEARWIRDDLPSNTPAPPTPITITVTLNYVPGTTGPSTLTYTVGGPGLSLPVLERPGYQFLGWSSQEVTRKGQIINYVPKKSENLWTVWQNFPAVGRVYFGGDSSVLRIGEQRSLDALAKKVLTNTQKPQLVVYGWVRRTANKSYDRALSSARANRTAAYLRSKGVDAFVEKVPKGIAPERTPVARRTDIQMFFSGPSKTG